MLKEFVSLTVVAIEMRKRHCFIYHSNSCKEEKLLRQKPESYTFKIPLVNLSWLEETMM